MHRPEINLSANFGIDAACNYDRLASKSCASPEDNLHICVLSAKNLYASVSEKEFEDLLVLGCPVRDPDELSVYRIAMIMGKHFKAGEWGMYPRCGSVITCVIHGRSLYARVLNFVKVDTGDDGCPGYACVCWFSEPVYINSLCPRVNLDGSDIEREVGRVIRITQIDPSQVSIEVVPGSDDFFMIRDSGYDTRKS